MMKWLVVEAALGLLRTLRRSAALVLSASEQMVVQLQQYREREDNPMAIVLPLPPSRVERQARMGEPYPLVLPGGQPVLPHQWGTLLDPPPDPTNPSQPA